MTVPMNADTRLAIGENIFEIEVRLQSLLFSLFLVMRGLTAGETPYVTGDQVPYWLLTLTTALLVFGVIILAFASRAVMAQAPPSERTVWWLVWGFRLKLGVVFFAIPLVAWWLV